MEVSRGRRGGFGFARLVVQEVRVADLAHADAGPGNLEVGVDEAVVEGLGDGCFDLGGGEAERLDDRGRGRGRRGRGVDDDRAQ